ncbi:MAG: gamma-glutamyltransferase [Bacteroidales bacterium]|nr:gamma-glutamyltransferase [Bacteroidales bacterium]
MQMLLKSCLSEIIIACAFLITTGCHSTSNESDWLISGKGITATRGMVSSAHPLASKVGARILEQGGNAFDAAVAVHFALAVVYPGAGNVAGGGFAVYRMADGETGSLDFREKAPKDASRNMYLNIDDEAIAGLSSFGPLSVGVPGSVDGMIILHKRLGSMPFEELIQPAVDLAEQGYPLTKKEADKLNSSQEAILLANDSSTFFYNGGKWKEGDLIINHELANTLKLIREKGRDGFYAGETARNLITELSQQGGIITQEDLDDYKSVWRKPAESTYRQFKIITMPPPSSGGIALIQLLKGSEKYDFQRFGHTSALSVHIMTELERRVYADRATYLGDPDYYDVPVKMLLDNAYLEKRFSDISLSSKTDSRDIKEGSVDVIESTETTHLSVVDKNHNAIAVTTTLNGIFGSKVYVEESGFFLNNEMDDFSVKPCHPNQFGLVGGEANAIAPENGCLAL